MDPISLFMIAVLGLLIFFMLRNSPRESRLEVGMLALYGVLASYVFGLVMNLWFWPIAVGPSTTLSLVEGGGLGENVLRWLVYSLSTSTLTWDTVRAITTVVTLVLVAKPAMSALRRAYERTY